MNNLLFQTKYSDALKRIYAYSVANLMKKYVAYTGKVYLWSACR